MTENSQDSNSGNTLTTDEVLQQFQALMTQALVLSARVSEMQQLSEMVDGVVISPTETLSSLENQLGNTLDQFGNLLGTYGSPFVEQFFGSDWGDAFSDGADAVSLLGQMLEGDASGDNISTLGLLAAAALGGIALGAALGVPAAAAGAYIAKGFMNAAVDGAFGASTAEAASVLAALLQAGLTGATAFGLAALAEALGIVNDFEAGLGVLGRSLGDGLAELAKLFGLGQKRSDPLVIDLTGNGLNLEPTSLTSPYHDYTDNGFATKTGWIGTGSGFLVIQEGNGSVQMLGNGSASGIAALEADFGGKSGVINASSSLFSELMVWEDTNGNGSVDPGELYSLEELGITSISLDETASGEVINGNTVEATLTYTMADGQTGVIGEVEFETDPTASTPDVPITIPASIESLPQLNGYGKMYDLHSAMVLNPALLGLVEGFVALPTSSSTATIENAVQAILYQWAGVTNVNPGSRGPYANAQQLEFLESYLGENYYQPSHGNNDPSPFGGPDISMAWSDAFNGLMARLILQSPLAVDIPEFTYDAAVDIVLPAVSFAAAIASMEQRLGAPDQANFSNWYLALQVVDASSLDFNLTPDQLYQLISEGASDATTQTVAVLAAAVAAGQTISFASNGSFVISGSTLNDVMYAGPGISKLIGNGGVAAGNFGSVYIGPNTDTTNGDVFVYNLGDGHLEINEGPSVGPDNYPSQATLSLGTGITPGQVTLTKDAAGDDILTIDSNGDVIQIDDQNLSGTPNYDGVSAVIFADGTVWTAQELSAMGDVGSPINIMLYGSQTADTFNSEGYATYAQGYGGGDTFIFNAGYGALEINENNPGQLVDNILTFGSGITPSEVNITAGLSGSVVLVIGTAGDKIILDNMLKGPQYGIDSVEFANGTIWSAQNIVSGLSLASGVSLSSYFDIEQLGQPQTSTALPNLIYLGYTNPADILFQADAAGDLTISTDGYVNDDIVLSDDLYGSAQSRAASLLFADGSTLSLNGSLVFTEVGTPTNTTLTGASWGNNVFELAPGGDIVTLGNGQHGGRQNTIDYNIGDGAATIHLNGVLGTIHLGAGITASNLAFQATDAAGDLTITVLDANGSLTGDSIFIPGDLYSYFGVNSNISLLLADGTSVPINGNLVDTLTGSATNTTLVGSGWEANLFQLAPGGDTVTLGNGHYAGSQQNVIDYAIGDGAATIHLNGVLGTIHLGAGITASNLAFQATDAAGDLTITVLDANGSLTGDSIFIPGDLYSYFGVNSNISLLLADGTSVPINGNLVDTLTGSATNTTLVGSGWEANLFQLAPGGDTVTLGNGHYAGSQQNVIDYAIGDGAATIHLNGVLGTIHLGAGITASNLAFQATDAAGDLTITVLDANGSLTGDSIFIPGDLYSYFGVNSNISLLLADGTSVPINGNLVDTLTGSATNTTLVGSGWEANLFQLAPGGDTVTLGNGHYAGSQQNVIDYAIGDGAATIHLNGVLGTIHLGAGITASNLAFQATDAAGDLTITVLDANGSLTGDSIFIPGDLYSYFGVNSNISVLLADGTSVPINGNLVDTLTGSATNTTLVGSGWEANLFELAPGGDTVTLGNGHYAGSQHNVIDYNIGDGAATIHLNGVLGTIHLGAGITASNLAFQATDAAGDLTITVLDANGSLTGDSIFIPGDLYSYFGINSNISLLLADGTSVPINGSLTDTLTASATNTTLVGSGWEANLFELAPGGDTVTLGNGQYGGPQKNTIDYNIGDGAVTINTNGANWNEGTIVMGTNITASELVLESNNANGNLTIELLNDAGTLTGDNITILGNLDYGGGFAAHVDDIVVGTGSAASTIAITGSTMDTWIASASNTTLVGSPFSANLFELAPGGDSVTFGNGSQGGSQLNIVDYNAGDGAVTINLNGVGWQTGTIVMGASITANELIFETDNANGNLKIGLLNAEGTVTGDSITIPGDLDYGGGFNARVDDIVVGTGSSASTIAITGNTTDTWIASATNTTLVGSDFSANLFELAPGGDSVIFGNGSQQGSQRNIVDYNIGDGAATINLNGVGWQTGTIVMGASITASELIFETNNANGNLKIGLLNAADTLTDDSITIPGDLDYGGGFNARVDDIVVGTGSAASTIAITGNTTDTWIASATNTTLVGSNFSANLFELAPGGDSVTFGNGSQQGSQVNTVDYGIGDGAVTINPNGATWNEGTIVFGAGITASNVIFQTNNNTSVAAVTLSLLGAGGTLTGDSITILNDVRAGDNATEVGDLVFANGTTLAVNGNHGVLNTWLGTSGTTLIGSDYGNNLFELAPSGENVTFGNGAYNGGNGEINTVDYGIGDGAVTINPNGATWNEGTIVFGAGITASNVIFQTNNNTSVAAVTLSLLGAGGTLTGDSITILNDVRAGDNATEVGDLVFANGTTLAVNGNHGVLNTWLGTSGTTLIGSDYGNNLFELAPSGENVTFGNGAYNGGNGEINTVDYGIGDGAVTINPNGATWNEGTIVFGAGITASNVIFQTNNNTSVAAVTLSLLGAGGTLTGDSITILNDVRAGDNATEVGDLVFANGTTLAVNGNHGVLNTWLGTSGTTLVGSDYGNNLFELAPGGENVTFGNGAYNGGNGEVNTVDYGIGDGTVTINPNGATWNQGTIVFGAGITASNIIVETDNAQPGNMTIALLGAGGTLTGDSITILNNINPSHLNARVGTVDFANGTTLNLNQTYYVQNTWLGSATNLNLVGTDYGDNIFDIAPGGDRVTFGNGSLGGDDHNTVDYNVGDGAITINPNAADWDYGTIVMGAGITQSNIIVETDNAQPGNMTIALLGAGGTLTGDSITILNNINPSHLNARVGTVDFANGTTLNLNQTYYVQNTWLGSATNLNLVGTDYGDNIFDLAPGGDQVTFGNGTLGGDAHNTVDYNIGDGAVTINSNGAPWNDGTIVMGASISASELVFESNNANGNLTIGVLNAAGTLTTDSITILGDLDYGGGFAARVDDIVVGTGSSASTIAITGNTTDTWIASATNTTLVGSDFSANLFELAPGGDSVTFGNGSQHGSQLNIVDYSKGDGAATIALNGGAGNIQFQSSITEQNLWFVQSGSNLMIDVLGSSDQLTVNGFFSSSGSISEIKVSDGLEIDSQLSNLIAAMAAFSVNNPGFNPVTATQMPINAAIQNEIAAAWHS